MLFESMLNFEFIIIKIAIRISKMILYFNRIISSVLHC